MSYVQETSSSRKIAAIAGTGAIQLLFAGGIVLGLTMTGIVKPEKKYEPTIDFRTDPPPPPPPEQKVEDVKPPSAQKIVAPIPPIPLPSPTPTEIETVTDAPPSDELILIAGPVTADPPAPFVPPPLPPTPSFTPKSASPNNGPTGWITTAEYPRRALTRGWEGSAAYLLTIGTNGRVSDCRVTSGTSHKVLDDATCKWVKRRARFEAATNTDGAKVAGSYSGTVTWTIPD